MVQKPARTSTLDILGTIKVAIPSNQKASGRTLRDKLCCDDYDCLWCFDCVDCVCKFNCYYVNCCPVGQYCCDGECCPVCCDGECCPVCCDGECCPVGQYCCDGLTCYNPSTHKCCGYGDGTVVKICEVEPTGSGECDTSNDEKCQKCGYSCSSYEGTYYTGNETYKCKEPGCVGDCHTGTVLCSTEYGCMLAVTHESAYCANIGDYYFCAGLAEPPNPSRKCYECTKDPSNPGLNDYADSKECID